MGVRSGGDFFDQLLEIAAKRIDIKGVDRERMILLKMMAQSVDGDDVAALLWLVDGPTLRLSYCWDNRKGHEHIGLLRGIAFECGPPETFAETVSVGALLDRQPSYRKRFSQLTSDPRLKQWFEDHHPGVVQASCFIPLCHDKEGVGLVQLVGCHQKCMRPDANSAKCLGAAAKVLASKVAVGRDVRSMAAIHDLQARIGDSTDLEKIVTIASEVLREYTGALACLIYRPPSNDPEKELQVYASSVAKGPPLVKEPLAATRDSLTFRMFREQRTVRLTDAGDEAERVGLGLEHTIDLGMKASLEVQLGQPLRAWMCLPITVEAEGQGGRTAIALVKVVNKQGDNYLFGAFSRTDEDIATAITGYLGRALPGAEILAALDDLATSIAAIDVKRPAQDLITGQVVFEALRRWIHGVVAMRFVFKGHSLKPILGIEDGLLGDEAVEPADVGRLTPVAGGSIYRFVAEQSGEDGGYLIVGFSKPDLTRFEAEIIRRACTEIGRMVADIKVVERMVEIRHAVRSGVQGMLGHIDAAQRLYHLGKARGARDFFLLLSSSRLFPSSLEGAKASAYRVSVLLDEARYAYSGLGSGQLQTGEHDLPDIIREVVNIIRPSARAREVGLTPEMQFEQQNRRAHFDRNAVTVLLFNLLDNAVKYSYRGNAVRISLSCDPSSWTVSVTNIGVYIDPADRDLIFRPFERATSHDPAAQAGVSSRPGTGLGLAICRDIIRAHCPDADITVQSELIGQSPTKTARTVFAFTLPRR